MIEISDSILDAFRLIVGNEFVVVDRNQCYKYETTTFLTSKKIPAIIYPDSTTQVQKCLKIANNHKISDLYNKHWQKHWLWF